LNKDKRATRNIRKPGDVGKFEFSTFIKSRNGLIRWSFEIPASAYCQPSIKKTKHTIITFVNS